MFESISKNVSISKPDVIGNQCSNTYYSTVKMRPADTKWSTYIDFNEVNDNNFLNLNLLIVWEYQNKKRFWKGYPLSYCEQFFVIKNVHNALSWKYVIENLNALMEKKLLEGFTKKNSKRQTKHFLVFKK